MHKKCSAIQNTTNFEIFHSLIFPSDLLVVLCLLENKHYVVIEQWCHMCYVGLTQPYVKRSELIFQILIPYWYLM